MSKEYVIGNVQRLILKTVTCDKCGKDCLNSFFDIMCKMSFLEEPHLIETICWECYEKHFRQKVMKHKGLRE